MMDEKDIVKAPTDIMFFTWLYKLMSDKHCFINTVNDRILDLDDYASNWFILGRDNETLEGFLGIPRTLLPWFAQIKFKQAVVNFELGRLYLSCGDEDIEGLTISLKIRRERLKLLWREDLEDDSHTTLDFRIFAPKADNTLSISENVIYRMPLINTTDLMRVVRPSQDAESQESVYADDIKARYQELYANKYLNGDEEDLDDEL